jgi:hypothetical protein
MKSAYELAMERLEKNSPSLALNETQKARIAEINSIANAKVAERELLLRDRIRQAREQGDVQSALQLEAELLHETQRIREEAELKKETVRKG